jgi:hypothetical protein
VRGGNIGAIGLPALQALTPGVITVTIDGVAHTSSSINLSGATSFSNAAAIIQTALAATPATVAYDSVAGAFVITSGTTGATSTISAVTGSMAAELLLTTATGAVSSQGAAAATPAAAMNAITAITTNWATFTTDFDPDGGSGNANKLLFAQWTSQQNNRYAYVGWDTDITPTNTLPASSSFGALLVTDAYSGTIPVYEPSDLYYAPFIMGAIASVDYTQTNGRATMAFKGQSGLTPSVTSATAASNLTGNGYNYYGIAANASTSWNFLQPGSISGPFKWIDSYANQIWLNTQLQAQLMNLLTSVRSIPYNAQGYALIEAAIIPTANQGLDNGVIRSGVTLSALQKAEVNAAAGKDISSTLFTRGWYLQIIDAPANVRVARGSPAMTFWYVDGQSIQQINLSSVDIQ